jgi:hypothetical protein
MTGDRSALIGRSPGFASGHEGQPLGAKLSPRETIQPIMDSSILAGTRWMMGDRLFQFDPLANLRTVTLRQNWSGLYRWMGIEPTGQVFNSAY